MPIKILLADDHAIVRRGMRLIILEEFPSAMIGEVGDAKNLIVEVIKSEWDILICDISMPGGSGIEALHQVKEINPGIPVLMMSMHPEDQYALRVIKAGASGYLNKESIHEELIKAIHTVRIGRKYITPTIAEKLAGTLNSSIEKQLHENLSNRELEILKMIVAGKSISDIAVQLSLSATTVSTYRSRILEKMSMKSNAALTRYALENNLI